jgi:hypothetical protein
VAWTHHLIAPLLDGGIAVFGDLDKHAPVGRARIGSISSDDAGVAIEVIGPEPLVTISGWSETPVDATVDGTVTTVRRDGDAWSVDVPPGRPLLVRPARS